MKVRDLMAAPAITVTEDCSLAEAAEVMLRNRIGSLPVVTAGRGELAGIITDSDFSAKEKGIPFSLCQFPQILREWLPGEQVEEIYARARLVPVREIMEPDVATVTEEDPLELALERMLNRHVHRLPVMRGKVPVGMISRRDLLRLMLTQLAPPRVS